MRSVLEIHPLTRVEGHGTIRVHLDGSRVERVVLSLCEAPRLFEALLVGKRYDEVPEIVCRICSICSSVHRVTSLAAVEQAMGMAVSERTRRYRELIVYGGQIASHALHLFCLLLPDRYRVSGFAGLAAVAPGELQRGLRIKAAGNLIQERVGGRTIHPVNLVPGGMGRCLDRTELLELHQALQAVLPDAMAACDLFASHPQEVRDIPLHHPQYLALQSVSAASLFGETLKTTDGTPREVGSYRELLTEETLPTTNAKSCRAGGDIPTTGALARLNIRPHLSRESGRLFREAADRLIGADIYANGLAQAVELVDAVERSLATVECLLELGSAKETAPSNHAGPGVGTAAVEAPRGLLIHCYRFNDGGFCTAADVMTPTSINQAAMERDLNMMARGLDGVDEQELVWQMESLVRAYDPCISCAVHLVRS